MIHQHSRTFGDKENDFLVPARTVWKGPRSCPHPHNSPCISLWNNYLQNCSLARFKHFSSAPLLSHTPTQSQFTTGCLCVIYHSHVVYLCAEAELMFFLFWTKKTLETLIRAPAVRPRGATITSGYQDRNKLLLVHGLKVWMHRPTRVCVCERETGKERERELHTGNERRSQEWKSGVSWLSERRCACLMSQADVNLSPSVCAAEQICILQQEWVTRVWNRSEKKRSLRRWQHTGVNCDFFHVKKPPRTARDIPQHVSQTAWRRQAGPSSLGLRFIFSCCRWANWQTFPLYKWTLLTRTPTGMVQYLKCFIFLHLHSFFFVNRIHNQHQHGFHN